MKSRFHWRSFIFIRLSASTCN